MYHRYDLFLHLALCQVVSPERKLHLASFLLPCLVIPCGFKIGDRVETCDKHIGDGERARAEGKIQNAGKRERGDKHRG